MASTLTLPLLVGHLYYLLLFTCQSHGHASSEDRHICMCLYIHVFIRLHINTWDVGCGVYMALLLTVPLL